MKDPERHKLMPRIPKGQVIGFDRTYGTLHVSVDIHVRGEYFQPKGNSGTWFPTTDDDEARHNAVAERLRRGVERLLAEIEEDK